jgi:hypothetical protein
VELHELKLEEFDLEQLFFTLTEGAHRGADLSAPGRTPSMTFQDPGAAR